MGADPGATVRMIAGIFFVVALGYNWLARRNKAVMDEVREFSDELNAVILGSAGKAA